mmetsp:Transcript_16027/g.15437  ORF Transcript_16027/g.15437 Transcript_16027/m.15437 type:complete len:363 (-) Transcript_16027:132-1220(-)|eukprot:CAMPEP_0197825862 /NCGR_PEP_ID=MMETSP1437-20131217/2894_1 /TAXON_ID=49252 ORGANISM="Eucampia antarctica, Strain CCMP1452" /NCGR_SAMPLE_ID=MMETSP1437 /ASSEMBLY_ACC=CAM_ASM_001096 /LENGTH=362 /DNA_ID=CAMNT_0043426049 /DNA_START=79 /DNA_END=1167 /DNA_ORIENTATION=-
MKLYANLLLLSVLYPNLWVSTAFAPTAKSPTCDTALFSSVAPGSRPSAPARSAGRFGAQSQAPSAPFGTQRQAPPASNGAQRQDQRQVGSESNGAQRQTPRRRRVPLSDLSPSWNNGAVPAIPEMLMTPAADVWVNYKPVVVQGTSLRTCSFDSNVERMEVILKSEGRPLNANIEVWQGPDNTPQKIKVYLEDGHESPFRIVVETPGGSNSIAVLNTGNLEFPMAACIAPNFEVPSAHPGGPADNLASVSYPRTVQGGAIQTVPLASEVMSVQIMLETDGRPMNAKIEILQGPNNIKQAMEVYVEDGTTRPFFVIAETPGSGNTVRIINTSSMEYPIISTVEPYLINQGGYTKDIEPMVWSE